MQVCNRWLTFEIYFAKKIILSYRLKKIFIEEFRKHHFYSSVYYSKIVSSLDFWSAKHHGWPTGTHCLAVTFRQSSAQWEVVSLSPDWPAWDYESCAMQLMHLKKLHACMYYLICVLIPACVPIGLCSYVHTYMYVCIYVVVYVCMYALCISRIDNMHRQLPWQVLAHSFVCVPMFMDKPGYYHANH